MDVVVRLADGAEDRSLSSAIRRSVFVEEQSVPEALEADGLDDVSSHFLALVNGRAVATARSRKTEAGYKLERVAVLRDLRGKAVGRALVTHVLSSLPPGRRVYVHAQHGALAFWERLGFLAQGDPFEEAGIAHSLMIREPPGVED